MYMIRSDMPFATMDATDTEIYIMQLTTHVVLYILICHVCYTLIYIQV